MRPKLMLESRGGKRGREWKGKRWQAERERESGREAGEEKGGRRGRKTKPAPQTRAVPLWEVSVP